VAMMKQLTKLQLRAPEEIIDEQIFTQTQILSFHS